MTIPSVDNTTLTNLTPNLDVGDVADPSLRLAAFQYIYTELAVIVAELNDLPTANIKDLAITAAKIANLAITTGKIAELAVTTAKLAEASVTLSKMATNSVGTSQLVDQAVSRAKIGLQAVGAAQLDASLLKDFGDIAVQAEFDRRGVSVLKYGAKGDGIADDTASIQNAFDNATRSLYFPPGTYKVSGSGDACLTLRRKLNIVGLDTARTTILGVNLGVGTSLLKISFDYAFGNGDVRNWKMENISFEQSGGGKHAVWINKGLSITTSQIKNCAFYGGPYANGGYGLYVEDNLSHCKLSLNTFGSSLYMKCFDANLIEKNVFFGIREAIAFDCIFGVYNNTVRDNTIVNRDGAVRIINGDALRIENNQIELATEYGESQSPVGAMLWVEGRDRVCYNTIISENNFGGGTNVDHLIYIDNAQRTIIDKNQFYVPDAETVIFTSNAKYNILSQNNRMSGSAGTAFGFGEADGGVGNVGTLHDAANLLNGWTGGEYFKDEAGIIHFTEPLNAGTTTAGTEIMQLPMGFRPKIKTPIMVYSEEGVGVVYHKFNGRITVKSLDGNTNLFLAPFVCSTIFASDKDIIVYDSFDRSNSTSIGNAETGETWNDSGLYSISSKQLKLTSGEGNQTPAILETLRSDGIITCTLSLIATEFAQDIRIIFRYVDSNNYLYVMANDTSGRYYSLYKRVAGVNTLLASSTTILFASGDVVKIELRGSNIQCYKNNVKWAEVTQTDLQTVTKHGIRLLTHFTRIGEFKMEVL